MTVVYKNRNEVPVDEKWNLTDIYSDIRKWEEDYQQIEEMNEKLKVLMVRFMMEIHYFNT